MMKKIVHIEFIDRTDNYNYNYYFTDHDAADKHMGRICREVIKKSDILDDDTDVDAMSDYEVILIVREEYFIDRNVIDVIG